MQGPKVWIELTYEESISVWKINYRFKQKVAGVTFKNQRIKYPLFSETKMSWINASSVQAQNGYFQAFSFYLDTKMPAWTKIYDPVVVSKDKSSLLFVDGIIPTHILPQSALSSEYESVARKDISISVKTKPGWSSRSTNDLTLSNPAVPEGFIYIGTNSVQTISKNIDATFDNHITYSDRKYISNLIDQVTAFYSEKLGLTLKDRLQAFIVFNDQSPNKSVSGNAIGKQIQITLNNIELDIENSPDKTMFLKVLFHELAHFYIRGHNGYKKTADSWLIEGSAEYLAIFAMRSLGLLTSTEFLLIQEKYINQCVNGLKGMSIVEASRSNIEVIYACGTLMSFLVDTSLKKQKKSDFPQVWEYIIAKNVEFSNDDYFNYLSAYLTQDEVNKLIYFATGKNKDVSRSFFYELIKALDYEKDQYVHVSNSPFGISALKKIMKHHCGGYSLWTEGNTVRLDKEVKCALTEGVSYVIGIDGFNIVDNGNGAYDSFYKKCKAKKEVTINTIPSEKSLTFTCILPVEKRPPYIVLSKNDEGR